MGLVKFLVPALALIIGFSGCSGGDRDPLTVTEALEAATGDDLNATEVNALLESAEVLCGLSDSVLEDVWAGLDDDQLGFQDFVFSNQCPERLDSYRAATGRLVEEGN